MFPFDFGAPVGFRVALAHDARVRAVISQNANAYTEGFGPGIAGLADWWADRQAGQAAIDGLVSLEGTRTQWLAGARDPEHVDPSQYLADQTVLDLPGRAQYMKDLLWDYQFTVPRYQEFHAWLRQRAPKVLAIWGRHDPFFTPAGAHPYRTDAPDAEGTGVTANCAHPGMVRTRFGREAGLPVRAGVILARPFLLSPQRGASTIVYLATSSEVAGATGGYYVKRRRREPSAAARDDAAAVAAQRGADRPHSFTPRRDVKDAAPGHEAHSSRHESELVEPFECPRHVV